MSDFDYKWPSPQVHIIITKGMKVQHLYYRDLVLMAHQKNTTVAKIVLKMIHENCWYE